MSFEMWEMTAKNLDVKLRAAEVRIAELEKTAQEICDQLDKVGSVALGDLERLRAALAVEQKGEG